MTNRKLPAMHELYGISEGNKCRNCCNLTQVITYGGKKRNGRTYLKCRAYGDSGGEASDWGNNFLACGLYNIPFYEEPLLERIKNGEV
jgi:hypothetical protein